MLFFLGVLFIMWGFVSILFPSHMATFFQRTWFTKKTDLRKLSIKLIITLGIFLLIIGTGIILLKV